MGEGRLVCVCWVTTGADGAAVGMGCAAGAGWAAGCCTTITVAGVGAGSLGLVGVVAASLVLVVGAVTV